MGMEGGREGGEKWTCWTAVLNGSCEEEEGDM